MEISASEADRCGFGNHAVFIVPNTFVTVADGVRLALRLWLPSQRLVDEHFAGHTSWKIFHGRGEDEGRFPAILEYLPYRKDDITAVRDFRRHTWTASHGYVVARADIRGTGDSDGLCHDEFTDEELSDGRSLIAWLSSQSWSSGRVGLYGKSWAGCNGLMLAEIDCPGLAAVISVYSTDDRYSTEVHHIGGCVHACHAVAWSSHMFSINALPPSPAARPDDWKEVWLHRLRHLRPWNDTWLRHQTLDDYWRRGSIRFDFDRVRVPIFVVGGWRDAYVDAVFRLSDGLRRSRTLLGPWSHEWPDLQLPGPAVHFVRECLRWWDEQLKDVRPERPVARFRVFARRDTERHATLQLGDWLAARNCRQLQRGVCLRLCPDRTLRFVEADAGADDADDDAGDADDEVALSDRAECGLYFSEWLSHGGADEAPDQRAANAHSTVWTLAEELEEDVEILGPAELTLRLRAEPPADGRRSAPMLGVRLCDEDPRTGGQRLVTWSALNLNLSGDQSAPRPFRSGEAKLQLRAVSYRVRRGHRLLLALSGCLWPVAWRQGPRTPLFLVASSPTNRLRLPLLAREAADACNDGVVLPAPVGRPAAGPSPPSAADDDGGGHGELRRWLERDFVTERYANCLELRQAAPAAVPLPDGYAATLRWCRSLRHSIAVDDCSDPDSSVRQRLELRWPSLGEAATVSTESFLASDGDCNFRTRHSVVATLNGEEFFRRTFEDSIQNQTAF